MTHSLFITTFRNLKIDANTGEKFELLTGINLTNDSKTKKKLLEFRNLQSMIGKIEFDHLSKVNTIVYCHFDQEDFRGLDTNRFLLVILLWIKALLRSAWLVKDHCLECDGAFVMRKRGGSEWECSGNFLAQRPMLADGTSSAVEFSIPDLQEWRSIHHRVESYLDEAKSNDLRFFMEKGYCRSGRALQFLDSARTAPNLAMRIAHLCSAFETLFSTDASELSHKLAERLAFFLGEFGQSKIDVFKTMKSAYAVRSKLTHGDVLKEKVVQDLPRISSTCDHYLRITLRELFSSEGLVRRFDVAPEKIDETFQNLIFGGQTFR